MLTGHLLDMMGIEPHEGAGRAMGSASSGESTTALILVGTHNRLLAVNSAAAHLIGADAAALKGQDVRTLGKALSSVATTPTAPGASHLLELPNGRTVLVSVGTVVGRNQQVMGRAMTLQEISAHINELTDTSHTAAGAQDMRTLQQQIQSMQELIDMLPRFSHHKYWQNLLVEHMQRLINQMTSHVQELQGSTTTTSLSA